MTPLGHTVPPLVTARGIKRSNRLATTLFFCFIGVVAVAILAAILWLQMRKHTQQAEGSISGSTTATPEPAKSPLTADSDSGNKPNDEPTEPTKPPPDPAGSKGTTNTDPPPPPPPAGWAPKIPQFDEQPPARPGPPEKPKTRAQLIREDLERTLHAPLVPTGPTAGPAVSHEEARLKGSEVSPADQYAAARAQLVHPSEITSDVYERQNNQAGKEDFYRRDREASVPRFAARQPTPPGACVIRAGRSIPAELIAALNSDLPGTARARVRRDVYDSDTGQCLAIPQGSILIGDYNSRIGVGQERLQVKWNVLQCPKEQPIQLSGMSGEAPDGSAGVPGNVQTHWRKLVGYTVLAGLFSAGLQISQSRGQASGPYGYPTVGQSAAAGIGQEVGQAGRALIERSANQQPRYTKPAGGLIDVSGTADLIFSGAYGNDH